MCLFDEEEVDMKGSLEHSKWYWATLGAKYCTISGAKMKSCGCWILVLVLLKVLALNGIPKHVCADKFADGWRRSESKVERAEGARRLNDDVFGMEYILQNGLCRDMI